MKKIIVALFVTGFLGVSFQTSAQNCRDEKYMDECASLLGSYVFVKSFAIEEARAKRTGGVVEYSYVLSKGTNYVITICDQASPGSKMIVQLYDRNRKLIAASYDKRKKKHYEKIGYACTATGVYYLKYSFEKGKVSCGNSIIGFSK